MRWIRANVSTCSWHTRNEGQRSDLGRMRDTDEGVLSGVADIVGVVEFGPHFGRLFAIEVKRPGSSCSDVSDAQNRFGRLVIDRGGLWTWVSEPGQGEDWCIRMGIVRPAGWRAPWKAEQREFDL